MSADPIVEAVRQVRRETEEACGHDWKRLMEHYQSVQPATGRLIYREPKRLPESSVSGTPGATST
jgi:hypothetical protein